METIYDLIIIGGGPAGAQPARYGGACAAAGRGRSTQCAVAAGHAMGELWAGRIDCGAYHACQHCVAAGGWHQRHQHALSGAGYRHRNHAGPAPGSGGVGQRGAGV